MSNFPVKLRRSAGLSAGRSSVVDSAATLYLMLNPITSALEFFTFDEQEALDFISDATTQDPLVIEIYTEGKLVEIQRIHIITRQLN